MYPIFTLVSYYLFTEYLNSTPVSYIFSLCTLYSPLCHIIFSLSILILPLCILYSPLVSYYLFTGFHIFYSCVISLLGVHPMFPTCIISRLTCIPYSTLLSYIFYSYVRYPLTGGCPRGVMVKVMDCGVRTPVARLCSLSGKYIWGRYKPPYPPSYGLNCTSTVLLGEWLWH